jgi:hypothetical protein
MSSAAARRAWAARGVRRDGVERLAEAGRDSRRRKENDVKTLIQVWVMIMVVCTLSMSGVLAEQEGKAQDKPQVNPEEMAAWQKAATPGPHHAHYYALVGTWNAEVKMWMAPGAEPMVAQMVATCDTIYGGRYFVEEIQGVMMGMPFKGTSISGYDNLEQKHTLVWYDNMSTGIVYSQGECSDQCKVETHVYTQKDAMTGKDQKVKMVSRLVNKDKWVLESYMIGEDGKENKTMEIVYTRA